MHQFYAEEMKAGDTIRFWLELEGAHRVTEMRCYASGGVADFIEGVDETTLLRGTLKALGQMKVYETVIDMGDDERGVSYPAAWRVTDVAKA